ncbi:MAG TPA: cyclic nucleotide-binding domain-containing protein [Turneriella sp.]|nr:cyclic nucleotide-binding domain-containing protein [Turneriella sp.]
MSESQKIQPLHLEKGAVVFAEGEVSNGCMYFIFSGEVLITKSGFGVIRSLSQGHFFGEMALVRAIPRSATAIVASATAKLGCIDLKTFAWLAKNKPIFLSNLISVVAKRAARAMQKVVDRGL